MKHLPDGRKSHDLSLALEHSIAGASRLVPQISAEQAAAPEKLAELLAAPPSEREQLLTSDTRFHTYSLAVQTLRRAATAIFHCPEPALELARLARSITAQVSPRLCGGTAALADLEAYTLAMEGNALRVSGDLQRARAIFSVARHVQQKGGADPDLMARIDRLEAVLCRDLSQLHTSLTLLDQAAKTFRALKAHDELARTLISRSNVFLVQRDFGKAENLLERALGFSSDPNLRYVVKHNLVDILVRSGRPREAASLFEEAEDLYQEQPDPLTAIQRIWLKGLIVRELRKDLEQAAELLTEAAARLSEHGYAMGAHLARIDLAVALRARAR